MAAPIKVPAAGQTTEELTLLSWRVKPGQKVKKGDILAEVETDKAVVELESYQAGCVLKLLVEEGETIEVGQTIAFVGKEGEKCSEVSAGREDLPKPRDERLIIESAKASVTNAALPEQDRGPASPAARRLARQEGIDLADITATGPGGTIICEDVQKAIEQKVQGAASDIRGQRVPLTKMQKAAAAKVSRSMRELPHFYVDIDVDMSRALAKRTGINNGDSTVKVTINDMVVKAVADSLKEFPALNCRLENGAICYLKEINIGIVVSSKHGLLVPVIANADRLSLVEVARLSSRLIADARKAKISMGAPGTFTVSNLGMYGVRSFSAIINPPEAAILAVGAIRPELSSTDQGIVSVPTMTATLSADHRIVDGVLAAQFLAAFRDRLESGL